MKPTLLTLGAIALLSAPLQVFAASGATESTNHLSTSGFVGETRAYSHRYRKTITRYYSNQWSIPTYQYYSEYQSAFDSHFSGNLPLTAVRYSNGGWIATYSGTLSGFWQ